MTDYEPAKIRKSLLQIFNEHEEVLYDHYKMDADGNFLFAKTSGAEAGSMVTGDLDKQVYNIYTSFQLNSLTAALQDMLQNPQISRGVIRNNFMHLNDQATQALNYYGDVYGGFSDALSGFNGNLGDAITSAGGYILGILNDEKALGRIAHGWRAQIWKDAYDKYFAKEFEKPNFDLNVLRDNIELFNQQVQREEAMLTVKLMVFDFILDIVQGFFGGDRLPKDTTEQYKQTLKDVIDLDSLGKEIHNNLVEKFGKNPEMTADNFAKAFNSISDSDIQDTLDKAFRELNASTSTGGVSIREAKDVKDLTDEQKDEVRQMMVAAKIKTAAGGDNDMSDTEFSKFSGDRSIPTIELKSEDVKIFQK